MKPSGLFIVIVSVSVCIAHAGVTYCFSLMALKPLTNTENNIVIDMVQITPSLETTRVNEEQPDDATGNQIIKEDKPASVQQTKAPKQQTEARTEEKKDSAPQVQKKQLIQTTENTQASRPNLGTVNAGLENSGKTTNNNRNGDTKETTTETITVANTKGSSGGSGAGGQGKTSTGQKARLLFIDRSPSPLPGQFGKVRLKLTVKSNGRTSDVSVIGDANFQLAKEAVRRARQAKFQPEINAQGEKIQSVTEITVIIIEAT